VVISLLLVKSSVLVGVAADCVAVVVTVPCEMVNDSVGLVGVGLVILAETERDAVCVAVNVFVSGRVAVEVVSSESVALSVLVTVAVCVCVAVSVSGEVHDEVREEEADDVADEVAEEVRVSV
jgi:hypothetical protein